MAEGGLHDSQLEEFLRKHVLGHLSVALQKIGVNRYKDLKYLQLEDFNGSNVKENDILLLLKHIEKAFSIDERRFGINTQMENEKTKNMRLDESYRMEERRHINEKFKVKTELNKNIENMSKTLQKQIRSEQDSGMSMIEALLHQQSSLNDRLRWDGYNRSLQLELEMVEKKTKKCISDFETKHKIHAEIYENCRQLDRITYNGSLNE